jgi:hypothetical protein
VITELEAKRLVANGRDSNITFDESNRGSYWLENWHLKFNCPCCSDQTNEVLIGVAFIHLK